MAQIPDPMEHISPNMPSEPPAEQYSFVYSPEELNEIYRAVNHRDKRASWISCLICWACAVYLLFSSWAVGLLFTGATVVLTLYRIQLHHYTKKIWTKGYDRVRHQTYHFDVWQDRICLTKSDEGGELYKTLIRDSEVESVIETPRYLLVGVNRNYHIFKKAELSEESRLRTAFADKTQAYRRDGGGKAAPAASVGDGTAEKRQKRPKTRLEKAATGLMIASIVSYVVLYAVISAWAYSNLPWGVALAIYIVFLLVPVACMVVGILLHRRTERGGIHIVVGAAMTVFLLFQLLTLIMDMAPIFRASGNRIEDPDFLPEAEQQLGITMPETADVYVVVYDEPSSGAQTALRRYAALTLTEEGAMALEQAIAQDARWWDALPTDMIGLLPGNFRYDISGNCLLYCVDSGSYADHPTEDGVYRYLCMLYDPYMRFLRVCEYDVTYTN